MFLRPMVQDKGSVRTSRAGDGLLGNPLITTVSADSNQVISVPAILGGIHAHASHTASRTDTTATAAAIIAAMPSMDIGDSYMFKVTSQAAFTIVVAGGTDVTASGNLTVAASGARDFVLTKASATTMTLVGL